MMHFLKIRDGKVPFYVVNFRLCVKKSVSRGQKEHLFGYFYTAQWLILVFTQDLRSQWSNLGNKIHFWDFHSVPMILDQCAALPGYFGDLFRHSKYVKNTLFLHLQKFAMRNEWKEKHWKGPATIRQAYSFVIQSSDTSQKCAVHLLTLQQMPIQLST